MPFQRTVACLLSLFAVPATAADPAGAGDPAATYAERALKEAGVATDGPGLLAYVRRHTLSDEDQERLAAAVRQLGAGEFEEREKASGQLVGAGRVALPFLRPALHDADLEVARRARRCLEEIERGPTLSLMAQAARLLAERRPAGAVPVLLAYLPCIDDDAVEEAFFAALDAVGMPGGKPDPALATALGDRHPVRRAAAAHVLGQAGAAAVRRPVVPLLADADPRVRYEAAAALVRAGHKEAVTALAALLTEAPLALAFQAESILFWAAGDAGPEAALGPGDAASRRRSRDAWEAWWRGNAEKVDLSRLQSEEPVRGWTLVCEYDGAEGGRVWEAGKDGKPRWSVAGLQGPNDVQPLPGGRFLVAERNGNRITERDRAGKVLWQHAVSGSPIACQRLANGNTLVATFNDLYEVTPDQRKVASHQNPEGFRHALKARNGHVVYVTSQGRVVELDAAWKERVRTLTPSSYAPGASYWASVEPLPGGRYLLALGGASRVVEIDGSGKVVWECTLPSAVFATRLRNGHTLVSCFEGRCVVEVDRAGKEVGKQVLQGRPFAVRRY
jgi:outer membrane protein assembly factor BamB